MHVFITGGAGFMGSYLTQKLLQRGDEVTVFDNMAHTVAENQARLQEANLIEGDILDADALMKALQDGRPDAIVHMAAIVSTPVAVKQPVHTARVNLEGTVNVLEAMRLLRIQKGFSISSEETYGPFQQERIQEDHPFQPVSPYGITKVAAEGYAEYYRGEFGVHLKSVRTSWVYGAGYPRSRPEVHIIRDAIHGTETILPCGAHQRLDFTHIDDFVDGMVRLLDAPSLQHHAYHISGDHPIWLPELVELLRNILPGLRVQVGPGQLEYSPGGMRMPQKGALDITRAREEVGYVPRVSLLDGMSRYVDYLRQRELGGVQV